MLKIVILGAGNVGTHLFHAIQNSSAGEVVQWYNRSIKSLEPFKNETSITDDLSLIQAADLCIISVADDSLQRISETLSFFDGIVVHTAGSVPMEILNKHPKHGVFYPLQTFSKQRKINFKTVPLCIEANSTKTLALLRTFAQGLCGPIHEIDSTQRRALHIAAVFVNNFTNHLYAKGEVICQEYNIPFSILKPLIAETAAKIEALSPTLAQTGPALRQDIKTIDQHLKQLSDKTSQELYHSLTKSIQNHYE